MNKLKMKLLLLIQMVFALIIKELNINLKLRLNLILIQTILKKLLWFSNEKPIENFPANYIYIYLLFFKK